jgi:hypothetical protein
VNQEFPPDHPLHQSDPRPTRTNTKSARVEIFYVPPSRDSAISHTGVRFWMTAESFHDLPVAKAEETIKALFSSFHSSALFLRRNKSWKDINPESGHRDSFIFYISHDEVPEPTGEVRFSDKKVSVRDFLERLTRGICFVFDRDDAGSLLEDFKAVAQDDSMTGFFSCGKKERIPRSDDYPLDIFTACLTTPARMAILFHSRNYFCFSTAPLTPLPILFVKDDDVQANQVLLEVRDVLRSTVEAIALRCLEPSLFVRLFRKDETLSALFVNFILSVRILSHFNVHPQSWPTIPDLTNAREWHTFDLRLDAALYQLSGNGISQLPANHFLTHHGFLMHTLKSMDSLIASCCLLDEFPFELAFYADILGDSDLQEEACNVLARYLDTSEDAIKFCLYFPQIPCRVWKLLTGKPTSTTLFCLIKFFAYSKTLCEDCGIDRHQLIASLSAALISSECKLTELLLICLCLVYRTCPMNDRSTGKRKSWIENFAGRIPPFGDLQIWFLLFLSESAPHLDLDQKVAFEIVTARVKSIFPSYQINGGPPFQIANGPPFPDESSPVSLELQLAVLTAIAGFVRQSGRSLGVKNTHAQDLKNRKRMDHEAASRALIFANSTTYLIRQEVFRVLSKFRDIYVDKVSSANPSLNKQIEAEVLRVYEKLTQYCAQFRHPMTSLVDFYALMLIRRSVAPLMDPNSPPTLAHLFVDQPATPIPTSRLHPHVYVDQIRQYDLEFSPTPYKHDHQITSDLIHIPTADRGQKLAFGDEQGNICIKHWSKNVRPSICQMTNVSITDLEYIENYGSPMIFATSQNGACHCIKIDHEGTSLTKFLSFELYDQLTPCNVKCTIAKGPMVLYSYIPGISTEFMRRDLRGDRILRPLKPKRGKVKGIHVIEGYSDCIAVIGSQFELWDLRTSFDDPVIMTELEHPPFALRALDSRRYAIATESPFACWLDLQEPASAEYRPVYEIYGDAAAVTKAFDAHPGAMTAIAHSRGLTLMNLKGAQLTINSDGKFHNPLMLNVNGLLFHEYQNTLAFVQDHSSIINLGIKEKR